MALDVESRNPHQKKRRRVIKQDNPIDVGLDDFSLLETPHPYGVLPSGNRFLVDPKDYSTTTTTLLQQLFSSTGKQQPQDYLTDECWDHILGFCNGPTLGRLIQTCRFFYVAAHQPELWRDLVLRQCDCTNTIIDKMGTSWKDTFLCALLGSRLTADVRKHSPIAVQGIYSTYYYRLHSCRSFTIPVAWQNSLHDTVVSIPYEEMTLSRFKDNFERPNRPVMIKGAALSWPACTKWTDCSYLKQHTTNLILRATSGVAPLPGNFTLDAYLNYCKSDHMEEAPLYLFDRNALKPHSILWTDYMTSLKATNPYWDPDQSELTGYDLFQVLGEGRRPDHTWLIVGPCRSGSVFHIDPNATHAWNATITGRKRWIFYPPHVTPPGVHPSPDGDEVVLPMSVGEWLFQFWEEHMQRKQTTIQEEKPLECTAMAGDVVFVPHGWWHMVINLDALNVAITHNYVSDTNLSSVLKFLDKKRDQVSGCRDRSESIKPESLFEEFVSELEKKHPQLLREAGGDTSRSGHHTEWDDKKLTRKSSIIDKAKKCKEGFSFSFL